MSIRRKSCAGTGTINEVAGLVINATDNSFRHVKPHRGTLILILGILSLVICGLVGIAPWIMGNADLKEIDAGTMDPSGRGATNAGRICGMIATILTAIGLVVGLIVICVMVFAGVHQGMRH